MEGTIYPQATEINKNLNYLKLFNFEEYDIFSLARHGKYVELEALLIKGLNPDSKDEYGNTILIIGAQNGNKRIVKMALRYGGQINMFNNMGNTALHFTNEYLYSDLSEYLIKKGANPEIKNLKGIKAKDGIKKQDQQTKTQVSAANKFILKTSTNMHTSNTQKSQLHNMKNNNSKHNPKII